MSRRLGIAIVVVVVIALLMVLIGNVATAHTNPPVTYTIQWDSPETEALARAACFDCHSNETVWPWYSYVAPMSILVAHDVEEGREKMNFSTGHGELEGREMAEQIERGAMPLGIYLPLHPEANLSDAQKAQLIQGLRATFGR
ncbi:MAG: heme-binding domain-containing protein [Anaerolineae bacterium]|nr:heme-binding domain-containing protein [Anaerolineae bacterium]